MNPSRDGLLRALMDGQTGPLFVLDSELRYVEFNARHAEAMQSLYGSTPRVGARLLDLVDEPARAVVNRNLTRALAGETVVEETPYPEEAPPPLRFRVTHRPVWGTDGQAEGVLVSAEDITLEAHATLELALSERRYYEALEASEFASWSYNGTTGETHFSDRYYSMLGYKPGSFPETLESWIALLHPEDAPDTVASFRHFIQTRTETFQLQYRARTASGGWRWLEGQAKVMERDSNGLPVRVSGTNRDVTRRKLAEDALRESEARWTSLVDKAPVGITIVGPGGVVQFLNHHQTVFWDSTALGKNWKEFIPSEFHPRLDEVLSAGFDAFQTSTFVTWTTNAQAETVWIESHCSPVLEEQSVTGLLIVSIDVTADRLISERRNKSSRRMKALLDLHNETHWSEQRLFDTALDAAIDLTSSEIGYVYFYSEETELFTLHSWSKTVMDQCRVTDPQSKYHLALTGYWGEAVRQRRPILVNDFGRTTDLHKGVPTGHVPLKRFLTIPVFENQRIVAVIGVGNKSQPYTNDDIDELTLLADSLWQLLRRRESEEALKRLYQAVEHAPVSIVITDKTGAITYTNPKYHSLTGYRPEEVLGANPRILKSGQMDPEVYQTLWQTILAGKDWQGELVNRKKDGTIFTELASISPVLDVQGAITHFIAVKEDITERKQTQELLIEAQKMETVGQLAAGVAHDFNNLLSSLLGYNQMLLFKLEPGNPLRLYAEKLETAGQKAVTLVSGLLAVGRRQRMSPIDTDLGTLVRDEIPLLNSLLRGRVNLKLDLAPDPLPVQVDPGHLSQAVVNLVTNANDVLEDGGTITLTAGRRTDGDQSWAWLRIEDDGPGIAEAIRDRVFEPFFTTKSIGKGTGLGLSIVRGVVLQMKGTVVLERRNGVGASFLISLPLVELA